MDTIACPDCDLLQKIPELPAGSKARCSRCAGRVGMGWVDQIVLPLALPFPAVVVFIVENPWPLMSLSGVGRSASTTIWGGVYQLWLQDEAITAVIVAFCAVIA